MQGSQAYARALAKAGVLTDDEAGAIVRGLDTVAGEWEAGAFRVRCCSMRHRSGGAAGGCTAVVMRRSKVDLRQRSGGAAGSCAGVVTPWSNVRV